MPTATRKAAALDVGYTTDSAVYAYTLSLQSGNLSPATVRLYTGALRQFSDYLAANGMPQGLAAVRREHVEAWLVSLLNAGSPASTVNNRYRSLQPFWKWAVGEGEITASPMAKMRPPMIPEQPAPVMTVEEERTLFASLRRDRSAEGYRDEAIAALLLGTGMRREELAAMQVGDVDWDLRSVVVTGKGRRRRTVRFNKPAALALRRYWDKVRPRHTRRDSPAFWLGRRGPMTGFGIGQVIERRANEAGLEGVHPHLFRHTFAHRWQMQGGSVEDLMHQLGWRSRAMASRYGASAAAERAAAAFDRIMDK